MLEIAVRVHLLGEPPFESKMKAGLDRTFLLKPCMKVRVKYDPTSQQHVTLDDEDQAILQRSPQLIKKK